MARRGFTVLELVIAVALIAALAGIAVIGGKQLLAGWRLGAATRQVVMDLKLARARAILGSAPHRLRFTPESDAYRHERQRPSGTYDPFAVTHLPAGVTTVGCTGAGGGLSFRPRGTAGAFGTVVLRDTRGEERAVVVDIAGRIRVQ